MSAENEIDELLRQDEADLKAKRKRLKAFATSVDDMRASQLSAATIAEDLISSGDLTRTELGRVFKLSRAEKSVLLPARRSLTGEAEPERTEAATEPSSDPEQGNKDSENQGANSQEN